MGITQVGSTTNTGNAASVTSRAPAVTTGTLVNDVAWVFLDMWESSDPAVTAPAGFNLLYKVNAGTGVKARCYWKRLTGTDSGTYSFSWSGAQWATAHCTILRGVKTSGDPVGAYYQTAAANSATFPSTSLTPPYLPGLLWHGYNDSGGAHTPPTGYTETADVDCAADAILLPASGGGSTFTASGATVAVSSQILSALVAVEPEPAAASIPVPFLLDSRGMLRTEDGYLLTVG